MKHFRDTTPCNWATPLANVAIFSARTAILRGEANLRCSHALEPKVISTAKDVRILSQAGTGLYPRNRSIPAGTGVWVEDITRSD